MSLDLSAWRAQAIRWLSAAVIAAVAAFAFLFVSVLAQAGADGTPVNSKLESVSVTPSLKLELDADRSQAVPGDTISYEGVVSNDVAALSLNGDVAVLNRFSSDARLASYFAFIEYFSADTRKWTPLAGMWNREDGFTGNQRPDIDTGLSLGLTRLTTPGVMFPASEDSELGTSLAKGATAQWKLSAKAPLSHAQLRFLQDERQVKNIRLVVRFDLQQAGSDERDGETEKQMFTAGLRPLSPDLEDVVVTLGLPDGQSVEIDKEDDPRLARLTPGAAADFAGVFQLAAVAERGLSESTIDYLDRLAGENGKRFNASASARATAGAAASIDGTPVGDPRAVSSEEANVSTQQQLPIVSLAKSGPAEVGAGSSATYAFLLENIGSSTAWITLTDEVDGGAAVAVEMSPSRVAPGEQARGEHTHHVSVKRKPGVMRDTGALNWLDRNDNSYGAVTDSFETMVIDITPPDPPVIDARPDLLTNKTTAQLTWTGEDEGFYECRLDDGQWSRCESPHELTDLPEGHRKLEVRQTDDSGNVGQPSAAEWRIDITPPEPPVVTSDAAGATNATGATFSFDGEPGGYFECRLDEAEWDRCSDPVEYAALVDGIHNFQVRQTDEAGNTGEPAERLWTVDTVAPVAPEFTAAPEEFTNETIGTFSFVHSEPVLFECSLDGADYVPCVGPQLVTSVAEGSHEFSLRAMDLAGNRSEPSIRGWIVDITPPVAPQIESSPAVVTTEDPADVTFSGEAGGTFGCAIDSSEMEPCISPFDVGGLEPGDHTIMIQQIDRAGNRSDLASATWTVTTAGGVTAPPLDDSALTSFGDQTSFLYSGDGAVQEGVAEGTIKQDQVAVLRGQVLNRNGQPLEGVSVVIADHPEFGHTTTRPDGGFYMAVNGGQRLVVRFAKDGFLSADRYSNSEWKEYEFVDDVTMIEFDPAVTQIDLSTPLTPPQIATGSVEVDQDGERQAKLLFETGTTASMTLQDGTVVPLPKLDVRATEYTVGENGQAAMPGPLPPQSGYTYAVDLSVDQAIAAGALRVDFSKPVISYTDNFLDFPVGEIVPAGYYDQSKAAWIPSDNGRVVKLLDERDSQAVLAVNSSGTAASQNELTELGVSEAELGQLADMYEPGESFWRVPIRHFTPWDFNWPWGFAGDADEPGEDDEPGDQDCPGKKSGSIIECDNQVLGEEIDLPGTPHKLTYRSDRVPGRKASRMLDIPLTGSTVSSTMEAVQVEVLIGGRRIVEVIDAEPNLVHRFEWDGLDVFGRQVRGATQAEITIRNRYRPVIYPASAQFRQSFGRFSQSAVSFTRRGRTYIEMGARFSRILGGRDSLIDQLGGWNIDVHHGFDPDGGVLHLGTGERRTHSRLTPGVKSVAGNADLWSTYGDGWTCGARNRRGDGLPAEQATLSSPLQVTSDTEGGYFILDSGNRAIRRVDASGIMRPVLTFGCSHPSAMTRGPNGSLYYVAGSRQIYQRMQNGTLRHVAGQNFGYSGDDGPATMANFGGIAGIALDLDGGILVADSGNRVIRKIRPDGIVHTIAGNGDEWITGDGGRAFNAGIARPNQIAVDSDGTIYFTATNLWDQSHVIRRIDPSGKISSAAGRPTCTTDTGDGGPATLACLKNPTHLVFTADRELLISDSGHNRIRSINREGVITSVAGIGGAASFGGDGGSAARANFNNPGGVEVMPDGTMLVADTGSHRIRKLAARETGIGGEAIVVGSDNGDEAYVFSSDGRHQKTVDTKTKHTLWEFDYDTDGRLVKIRDGSGNATSLERAPDGRSITVVGPYGARTEIAITPEQSLSPAIKAGLISSVTDPGGHVTRLEYAEGGLLREFISPGGGASTFDFDADGLLVGDTNALGHRQGLVRNDSTKTRSVSLTTAAGRTTQYRSERLIDGNTRRTNVNEAGLASISTEEPASRIRSTQPGGLSTLITKGGDPRFGLASPVAARIEATLPSGKKLTVDRSRTAELADKKDKLSLTELVDTVITNGRATSTTFTLADRRYVTQTTAGRSLVTEVDAMDRPIKHEAPGRTPVTYTYDGRGRLASAASDDRSTTFSYGSDGQLASTTDPLGRVVTLERDLVGRVVREVGPDGSSISFAYDADGNVTSITPPGRPAHSFAFDLAGLTADYSAPGQDEATSTKYTYDADGAPAAITRPDGARIELDYDDAGRISEMLDSDWGTSNYSYSATSGNLAQASSPDGQASSFTYDGPLPTRETTSGPIAGTVDVTYDNDFRPTSSRVNGAYEAANVFDLDGLLTKTGDLSIVRDAQSGMVTGTTLGGVATEQTYNAHGELAISGASASGSSLLQMSLVRDRLGRVVSRVETTPAGTSTTTYLYDDAGRLSQVLMDDGSTASYSYDANGNRTSRTTSGGEVEAGAVDQQDRLTSYGGYSYQYDESGDLLTKTRTSDGAETEFDYDSSGNLQRVQLPSGSRIEYLVDATGRRVGKKINGAITQGLLYGGPLQPVAELNASGAVRSRFVYGTKENVPEYMVKDGVTYRMISDHLGSPRFVVNSATGTVAQELEYDEFGRVLKDTNPGFQPFGFAGGLYDTDTQLVRFGARDYDPAVGRWTTKDPIGFAGGDANLYGYVLGDPVNWVDASGLLIDELKAAGDWIGNNGGTVAGVVAAGVCVVGTGGGCLPAVIGAVAANTASNQYQYLNGGLTSEQLLQHQLFDSATSVVGLAPGLPLMVGGGQGALESALLPSLGSLHRIGVNYFLELPSGVMMLIENGLKCEFGIESGP